MLFDKEEVRERLKKLPGGPMQPLTIHLRQEIDRLNIIVRLATTTLQNLRLAIAGTVALSGELIEALDALFMARIPAAWLKKSWEVRQHPAAPRSQMLHVCRPAHANTRQRVQVLTPRPRGVLSMCYVCVCCAVCVLRCAGIHTWQLVHGAAAAARPAGQVAHVGPAKGLLAHRLLQPPGERLLQQRTVTAQLQQLTQPRRVLAHTIHACTSTGVGVLLSKGHC